MKNKTRILIYPGRPAKDNPGAIHEGVYAADINLQVAIRLADKLTACQLSDFFLFGVFS